MPKMQQSWEFRGRMISRIRFSPEDVSILGDLPDDYVDKVDPIDDVLDDEGKDLIHFPSKIFKYFNESAMPAKERNALPDSEFGIPRLRAYPLNDAKHVKQAVRMFRHCKDPEDQKTLAANIFKAAKKYNVTFHVGKNNPLYQYAPKSMQEADSVPPITGFGAKMAERTREDVIEEHLRMNANYFNNIFYGPEYLKSIKALGMFDFLDYFYPNFTHVELGTRLRSVCGGLATPNSDIYDTMKMRNPYDTDFTKEIGWTTATEDIQLSISSNYYADTNWFKVDLSDDLNHIFFCLRLYSIMAEIFLDPNFDPRINLSEEHQGLLMDWNQMVTYHYNLYLDAAPESMERRRQQQYLWDLFWNYTDNPDLEDVQLVNVISMLRQMACVEDQVVNINEANVPGELISKEDCTMYLVQDLEIPDDVFLLPDTMEHPILNKASVKLAMDKIRKIPDEDKEEYARNLNRKYKELGCTFSISVDHPYAQYADKAIVANMTHYLLEGETVVDDDGTSGSAEENRVNQPFYKKVDYMKGSLGRNLAQIRDRGPQDDKKRHELTYDVTDSSI